MSDVGKAFIAAFGRPEPETPDGLRFSASSLQSSWKSLRREIKSGWFADRFLYLFGEGLDRLLPSLRVWSFLVPPNEDRLILGRNAHGALLVLDDANTAEASVHVLDPFRVVYWSDPDLAFMNLIGHWLPRDQIPYFLDRSVYDAWAKTDQGPRADDMILAPKRPEGLGGPFDIKNFQEEDIAQFYATTGPIYEKAFARMGRPKPTGAPRRPPPSRKGSRR
jgi:hypothetical protein